MSVERGWIIERQSVSDPAAGWVAQHRVKVIIPIPRRRRSTQSGGTATVDTSSGAS